MDWTTPETMSLNWTHVQVELLMDIRAQLQTLNRGFQCENFLRIPKTLDQIRRNTARRRRKVKK